MQEFLEKLYGQVSGMDVSVAFSEGEDVRVLDAVKTLIDNTAIKPTLIGNTEKINKLLTERNVPLEYVVVLDPSKKGEVYKLFSKNGVNLEGELDKLNIDIQLLEDDNPLLGTLLVKHGISDGLITGATHSTAKSIKPALKFIEKKEKYQKVSGAFFMKIDQQILLFADTAVTIKPEVMDLVDIAEDTVETAKNFGIEPKVAFLSFSTKGSADHPDVEKMARAASIFKDRHPEIPCDGEFQADAALVPEIAMRKAPDSEIKGDATILIFPDLNSANIAYKLVERLAKARAIGPVLQGLKKPVNDLSRGCTAQDIADIAVITALEAAANKA